MKCSGAVIELCGERTPLLENPVRNGDIVDIEVIVTAQNGCQDEAARLLFPPVL